MVKRSNNQAAHLEIVAMVQRELGLRRWLSVGAAAGSAVGCGVKWNGVGSWVGATLAS